MFQTDRIEVEFFGRVVLDMTGHIIGYLSKHELQEINFLLGVRRWASGTLDPSFTKPRRGWALGFLRPSNAVREKWCKVAVK